MTEVQAQQDDEVVTGKDLAAILGFRPSYIVELKHKGRLVLAPGGKGYLKRASLALYHGTVDPAASAVAERHAGARLAAQAPQGGPPAQDGPGADDEGDDEPLAPPGAPPSPDAQRKAKALADKAEIDALTAQMEYDQKMGRLLPAAPVEHRLASAVVTFRVRLERMVDGLTPRLTAARDETSVREMLRTEITQALQELAKAFRKVPAGELEEGADHE